MSGGVPDRILFCDYDGEFEFAETLSSVGYLVDQIRPDALRQVGIGDHQLFLFSFESGPMLEKALVTCEKLKGAQLETPIVLLCRDAAPPKFLNHQKKDVAAEAYLSRPKSSSMLLDCLDKLLGIPIPPSLRSIVRTGDEEAQMARYLKRIEELQSTVDELQGMANDKDKALEAQRNYYKPKLKAILEGQKVQIQTETESLKVALSELEAKLLDREARLKELENTQGDWKSLEEKHAKAQDTQRAFYQQKIKKLEEEKKNLLAKLDQD